MAQSLGPQLAPGLQETSPVAFMSIPGFPHAHLSLRVAFALSGDQNQSEITILTGVNLSWFISTYNNFHCFFLPLTRENQKKKTFAQEAKKLQ
jgi:hypothetical protein